MSPSRRALLFAVVLPIVVAAAAWFLVAGDEGDATPSSGGAVQVGEVDDRAVFEHDFLIPRGTADRIEAGEEVEIVPREMVVKVGEAIRIVNEDDRGHVVGVFYVGAGETLTKRFDSAGVLEGECSVHPSGAFTLRIEA